MLIRTGLLHVPLHDAECSAAVLRVLREAGLRVVVLQEAAISAQRNWLAETLRAWCDEEELELVLTIGGTLPAPGLAAAECVPEATLEVLERQLPGLSETMRAEASATVPLALLDRGVTGIRCRTLVLNLPEGAAAPLFLAAVADLLSAALAHLCGDPSAPRYPAIGAEPDSVADAAPDAPPDALPAAPPDALPAAPPDAARTGLNADEFAAFIQRQKKSP